MQETLFLTLIIWVLMEHLMEIMDHYGIWNRDAYENESITFSASDTYHYQLILSLRYLLDDPDYNSIRMIRKNYFSNKMLL